MNKFKVNTIFVSKFLGFELTVVKVTKCFVTVVDNDGTIFRKK